MILSRKPGRLGGDEMSSPDQSHLAKADYEAGAGSTDERVTPGQIRESLRTLAREIVSFVRIILLNAGQRGQIWWRARRAAIQAAGTSLGDRWPGAKAILLSSTKYARWPNLDPRRLLTRRRHGCGPKACCSPRLAQLR